MMREMEAGIGDDRPFSVAHRRVWTHTLRLLNANYFGIAFLLVSVSFVHNTSCRFCVWRIGFNVVHRCIL